MTTLKTTRLDLSWSTSRGRDTYGYNIARLDDQSSGKRFRCNGGGYDMVGTVFGEWLQNNFQDRLMAIGDRVSVTYDFSTSPRSVDQNPDRSKALYGMARLINLKGEGKKHFGSDRIALDGACGLESMIRIAQAIGLDVERIANKKGHLIGFIVSEVIESQEAV
jgi:hypothetical protein